MSDCPNKGEHTSCPTGYIEWHEWAEQMMKRGFINSRKCKGCGRYEIWIEKEPSRER